MDSAPWAHLFREPSPDAKPVIEHASSFLPQTPIHGHGPSDVFIVKALEDGGTAKYRVHCDLDATLAVLRDTLQNDEDAMMSADDHFHQGDFRIGKSAEAHIKWRDILEVRHGSTLSIYICALLLAVLTKDSQGDVIGIRPKNLPPSDYSLSTRGMGETSRDHPSSSPVSLPPATVPLHVLSRIGTGARIYGNFANEQGGHSYDSPWVYAGLVCRIWEKQESGMVPLRRLKIPKFQVPIFLISDEDIAQFVEKAKATIEFTVGYVYRHDNPCPEGAVPLYFVNDVKIGHCFTISKSEKDLCVRLGARNMGIFCYVAPP